MRAYPVRLLPGDDLRQRLEALAREHAWPAACVLSGIGSLSAVALRLAGAEQPRCWRGEVEVLTLSGSVSADGAHLHATLADAQGQVIGGHVCVGCEVRTTAELMLVVMDDHRFTRRVDPVTGYAELVIEPVDGAGR